MAMTKKEREQFDKAIHERNMARAMRWPEYDHPKPAPVQTNGGIELSFRGYVVTGSFNGLIGAGPQLRGVWSTRVSHQHSEPDATAPPSGTSSQGTGKAYLTQADAWRAYRLEITRKIAAHLAMIDGEIYQHDSGDADDE